MGRLGSGSLHPKRSFQGKGVTPKTKHLFDAPAVERIEQIAEKRGLKEAPAKPLSPPLQSSTPTAPAHLVRKQSWVLSGNTFAHREAIREMGGRWDADRKAWVIPYGSMREKSERGSAIYALSKRGVEVREE